nr:O-acetylhomoserine aminocarboxypropyltransferase/cysteine synthase [Candidatus Sigynarchaeota archaeon]
MTEKRNFKFETVAVHGGYEDVEPTTRSRAVPIYQTTSYTFKDDQHAANLFGLKEFGNIYTRLMNPTTDILEKRISLLEGGVAALAVASGQSAEFLTIMQLLRAGDEFSASQELYGGTRTLFEHTLSRFGIKANFFNPNDLIELEKTVHAKTKAIFIESLPNPSLVVPDIEAIATIAHKHQIPLIVDNTVPSPALLNPIKFGADIVVHSTTKYISGHGYSLGGVIVDSGKFPWGTAPHFKEFDSPDPSYHGLNFWRTFGNISFILKARVQLLRDIGPAASPFNSWLALIGLETLPLRMERICANAQKIAEFLKTHPKVAWVNYPGLRSGKDTVLLKKYLPRGYSGILGLGLKGGYDAGKKLINHVRIFSHLANIGDAKSLIIHPASTTHQQLEPKDQVAAGVTPEFIRLSIGIENVDDLIEDLDIALSKV